MGLNIKKTGSAFTATRTLFPLLIGFMVLIGCGLYYYVRVQATRDYLVARNFRQLNLFGTNLQQRIDDLREVVKNVNSGYSGGEVTKASEKSSYNLYLKSVQFQPADPARMPDSVDQNEKVYIDPFMRGDSAFLRFTGFDNAIKKTRGVIVSLEAIARPLAVESIFGTVLVLDSLGRVLFQKGSLPVQVAGDHYLGLSDVNYAKHHHAWLQKDTIGEQEYDAFVQTFDFSYERTRSGAKRVDSSANSAGRGRLNFHWTVCGYVPSRELTKQSLQLSYNTVLLIVFVLVMIGLGSRLLKLHYLSPREEFRRTDVYTTVFAGIFGIALCTVVGLSIVAYEKGVLPNRDKELQSLASAIDSRMKSEFASTCGRLRAYEDTLRTCIGKPDTMRYSVPRETGVVFSDVFLADSASGKQIVKWTTDPYMPPPINVLDRDYFKRSFFRAMWHVDTSEYYAEPRYTWSRGRYETAISLAMQDSFIAVMSILPQSVVDPVIAGSCRFCVIDEDGNVLYHSNPGKNGRENFFEECDNDAHLRSTVIGRYSDFLDIHYWDSDFRAYAKPIAGLPWTVIVFQDEQFARSLNLEIISFTVIVFFCHFIILILLFFVLHAPWNFRATWLWPSGDHVRSYKILTATMVSLAFGLSVLGMISENDATVIFCSSIGPAVGFLLCFLGLSDDRNGSIPVTAGVIFVCFVLIVWVPGWLAVFPLLAILALLIRCRNQFLDLLGNRFVWIPRKNETASSDTVRTPDPEPNAGLRYVQATAKRSRLHAIRSREVRNWYLWGAMSLVFLTAIVPTWNLFRIAYHRQVALSVRMQQLKFLHDIETALWSIKTDSHQQRILTVYDTSYFGTTYTFRPLGSAECDTTSSERDSLNDVVAGVERFLMPSYNSTCLTMHSLIGGGAEDGNWIWRRPSGDVEILSHRLVGTDSTLSIQSQSANKDPGKQWTYSFILILLISAGAVPPVRYTLRRVYFLHFYDGDIDAIRRVEPGLSNQLVLDPGTPVTQDSTSKAQTLQGEHSHEDQESVAPADVSLYSIDLESDEWHVEQVASRERYKAAPFLILNHFEYRSWDHEANAQKLELLEFLFRVERIPVVIHTALDPFSEFALYDGSDEGKGNGEFIRRRWRSILNEVHFMDGRNHFSKYERGPGVRNNKNQNRSPENLSQSDRDLITEIVRSECAGEYELERLQTTIRDDCFSQGIADRRFVIERTLHHARPYYHRLWQTCSLREKRGLLDLVKDGFPNPANQSAIHSLLRRGLVYRNPELGLFNESFRKYVGTHKAAGYFKADESEQGESSWQSYRIVFFVLFAVVALFLFVTQQKMLDTSVTFLTTLGTVVTLILKLSGTFKSGKGSDAA